MDLEILFEDNEIIVCYKPAGVPTQTQDVAQMDMVDIIRNYRCEKGEDTYVGVLQRLDQPVEGVMVFAKNPKSAGELSKQVQNHTMGKKYYAIVEQEMLPVSDNLVDYLVKDGRTNRSKVVSSNDPRAKLAQLHYEVIKVYADLMLLEVSLDTGRHHQIRVQLASRMAPIVGDTKYGGRDTKRALDLCAYEVHFVHPTTGEKMQFTIQPKGEDFVEMGIE